MARGKHLFPFRTEKLSPSAPMVLGSQGPGRVGRRRFFVYECSRQARVDPTSFAGARACRWPAYETGEMQCPGVAGTAPGRRERCREGRRWRGGCARLAGSTLLPSLAYRGPMARVAGSGISPLHKGALSHGVPTSSSSTARSRRPSQSQSRSGSRRNIRSDSKRGRGRNDFGRAPTQAPEGAGRQTLRTPTPAAALPATDLRPHPLQDRVHELRRPGVAAEIQGPHPGANRFQGSGVNDA